MSELNLVPNVTVVIVQTGFFLVNSFVVKKLIVDPYLKVKAAREALTAGAETDAARLTAEAEALAKQIESRLIAASKEAGAIREATRAAAAAKRQELLKAAEKDAKATVSAVASEIVAEVAKQKTKVPEIVQKLTDDLYKLAVS